MKFTKVDESVLTVERRDTHNHKAYFTEFMKMNTKIVEVEIGEHDYKTPEVAYSCIAVAAKRHGFPIDVHIRNGKIYLSRRDM